MITAIFSLLLLADSTSTEASAPQPAPAVAATPATKAAPADERKICKREGSTESRLGNKRICLTAKEWEMRKKSEG